MTICRARRVGLMRYPLKVASAEPAYTGPRRPLAVRISGFQQYSRKWPRPNRHDLSKNPPTFGVRLSRVRPDASAPPYIAITPYRIRWDGVGNSTSKIPNFGRGRYSPRAYLSVFNCQIPDIWPDLRPFLFYPSPFTGAPDG